MDALFWLLLPVAAISGWIAAFGYFKSLNLKHLPEYAVSRRKPLNEISAVVGRFIDTQPDKAVDIVIDKVEVNADTVEVHLALGNLYRRSGEVSRAIRFHQNLSEKHSLSHSQRESILFELGRDYLSAGLFDRAERIFKDLLTADEFKVKSCKALVDVFQQEKDWDEALEYAEMYEHLSAKSQKIRIAHFYCEKAEKLNTAANDEENEEVKALLCLALKKDKSCVRANIFLGDISLTLSDYPSALKYYMAVVEQDRDFLSVVFENLIHCYLLVTQNEKLATLLPASPLNELLDGSHDSSVEARVVSASEKEDAEQSLNKKRAAKYIEQQLGKAPTLSLLNKYLSLSLDDLEITDRRPILQLKNAVTKITKVNATYKCVSCGLGVHALHWQCPSCSNWSTIKPL